MNWGSKFDDYKNIISFLVVNKVCLLETNCLKYSLDSKKVIHEVRYNKF